MQKLLGENMNRATDIEIADSLLSEWHHWADQYRPKLGAPRIAPYCQQSVTSRQWESSTDASCSRLQGERLKKVEFCIDQLPTSHSMAIGLEMKNRQVRHQVWSNPRASTYQEALAAVLPIMRKEGLMD